jgi:tetratricopeptide (TPR) repeat protein
MASRLPSRWLAFAVVAMAVALPATAQEAPPADAPRAIRGLIEQRRFVEAAKAGEALVKERPDDGEAWLLLAYVHLSDDWPFRRDARAKSAAQRALKVLGRRPDVLAALAVAHSRLLEYDDALPLLAELCDATPPRVVGEQLAELLVLRADLMLKRGGADPAAQAQVLRDLDRAITASPRSAAARVMRAEALMNADRHQDALPDLLAAIEVAPGSRSAHAGLRNCYARLGQRDAARRHHEIFKRLNRLVDSVATTSAPEPEERRTILRELATMNPRDLDHRLQLASLELELGDAGAALAACDALLADRPDWPPARWVREQALRAKSGAPPQPADRGGETGGGAR